MDALSRHWRTVCSWLWRAGAKLREPEKRLSRWEPLSSFYLTAFKFTRLATGAPGSAPRHARPLPACQRLLCHAHRVGIPGICGCYRWEVAPGPKYGRVKPSLNGSLGGRGESARFRRLQLPTPLESPLELPLELPVCVHVECGCVCALVSLVLVRARALEQSCAFAPGKPLR